MRARCRITVTRILSLALIVPASHALAQPVFTTIFPADEYAARRARVMNNIGDAAAILQGTTETPGEQPFRQNNQFFYLSGVLEPRAILVIDGKTKRTTLFLNPRTERQDKSMYGPGLSPGEAAAKETGVDAVLPRGAFRAALTAIANDGRAIYTPFRPEVLGSASASGPLALARATNTDPWDGRSSREEAFILHVKDAAPTCEIRNLDPILDRLRAIKSPREIETIRQATRIAGLGIMEAMRDAKPGMREYELQADCEFVFKKYGAFGPAYFALIATGRNTYYTHYHKGVAVLADGDLVQLDYAPDYKYYASDTTRVFPANGKFTPWQRELYGVYLLLYRALMTSIRVHIEPREIIRNAVEKMDAVLASYPFTDPKIKTAAVHLVDSYHKNQANSLGHNVGMEVHDVRSPFQALEPGQIFTIEPQMRIEEEHLGLRLEDMILMTPTGYENLSAFVPIEIADIEKLMACDHGLSAAHSTLGGPRP